MGGGHVHVPGCLPDPVSSRASLRPIANSVGILIPIRPRGPRPGNANGIIIGREQGVGRLTLHVVHFGLTDDGSVNTVPIVIGRNAEESSALIPDSDVGWIAACVGQARVAGAVQADVEGEFCFGGFLLGEGVGEEAKDGDDAGDDADCGGHLVGEKGIGVDWLVDKGR